MFKCLEKRKCLTIFIFMCFALLSPILGRPTIQDNSLSTNPNNIVNTCDEYNSNNWFIYCSGRLLEAAMEYNLYPDSKTFVDKPMRIPAVKVQQAFDTRFPSDQIIDRTELQQFVDEYFESEGTELDDCELVDWQENPVLLSKIKDKTLHEWALHIHSVWKKLCRKMKTQVLDKPDQYSLLYVPNQFVVPGGRFREFYYWDAYWIIKGLIASGMTQTSKDMIDNFIYMVDNHGFVPNGGRVYYLRRSQPPMLISMAYEYYEATGDIEYISKILPTLEKELNFWYENRQINVTLISEEVQVFQYRTASNVPRPESYREDVTLVQNFTDTEKRRLWRNVASAAESGWDFSSRWFEDSKNLDTIDTINVVPVDLNAFICGNLHMLSFFYEQIGNVDKAEYYNERFEKFRNIFQKIFYLESEGAWFDFNLRTKKHNTNFYASMAVPLFTGCYHSLDSVQAERVYNTMSKYGAFGYSGGVPTSLLSTNQQWDFPMGWSPSEHMIIEGFRKSSSPVLQEKAYRIAENWLLTNLFVFTKTDSNLWEKYNVEGHYPSTGSGGEYAVQAGFGWTNGVILDLLVTYSDRLLYPQLDGKDNIDDSQVIETQQINKNQINDGEVKQANFIKATAPTHQIKFILAFLALYKTISILI